ncbi:MAG TPA: hypothetical protein VGG74_29900 [Kofleriaceae bacterium]|jgi:hypothetical protein
MTKLLKSVLIAGTLITSTAVVAFADGADKTADKAPSAGSGSAATSKTTKPTTKSTSKATPTKAAPTKGTGSGGK